MADFLAGVVVTLVAITLLANYILHRRSGMHDTPWPP
jgi:hypothetical protein